MSHEQSNQPQFSSSDPIEEQRRWGARTLRLQGLLTVFGAFAYACNKTPLVGVFNTIIIGFGCAIASAVVFLILQRRSSSDERWYLVPMMMAVETAIAAVLLWVHDAQYTFSLSLFLAMGVLLIEAKKPLAYGGLLALAAFSGFLLGDINSVGALGAGLAITAAAMAQVMLILVGLLKVFSTRWQRVLSVFLCVSSILITILAAISTLVH